MHSRPFRFGVATGSACSRAEWVSRARRAEELGYATLVVADHLTTGLAPVLAPWHICSKRGLLGATSSTNKAP
jgi:alkanesulfonate monooxygenase SsuD/methylene tetrahydromethanopterin reductase-like flavin-dependent oxidoreductase (luciferase family)